MQRMMWRMMRKKAKKRGMISIAARSGSGLAGLTAAWSGRMSPARTWSSPSPGARPLLAPGDVPNILFVTCGEINCRRIDLCLAMRHH